MPRLGNILSDIGETAIATSDGDIHIKYYPNRVTQKMTNRFRTISSMVRSESTSEEEKENANQELSGLILHLIKSWDLEDEVPCGGCEACKTGEGEECQSKNIVPFPLAPDRLDELPVAILVDIMDKLIFPNLKTPQKTKKN